MSCHITQNWRGRPLESRAAVVELIGATTTKTGLTVDRVLDEATDEKGIKVSDAEMDTINISGHDFHPEWDDTIRPRQVAESEQLLFGVSLGETARMVDRIACGGVSILLTNGSLGEGAALTASEHRVFTACIVDVMQGRGRVFAGVTTLNTRDTIARARSLVDVGADGLFPGRPMWMSLDAPSIVRYYQDIAAPLPRVPIIVYDNQFAFKAKITTETYAQLGQIPEIVGTKHIGGPAILDDLRAVERRMRILPLDTQWPDLAKAHPEDAVACWSGNVAD